MNSMGKVTHDELLEKLVEHESKFLKIDEHLAGIRDDLDPIASGVKSMAFAFKGLLVVGAGAAAFAGILELIDRLST